MSKGESKERHRERERETKREREKKREIEMEREEILPHLELWKAFDCNVIKK